MRTHRVLPSLLARCGRQHAQNVQVLGYLGAKNRFPNMELLPGWLGGTLGCCQPAKSTPSTSPAKDARGFQNRVPGSPPGACCGARLRPGHSDNAGMQASSPGTVQLQSTNSPLRTKGQLAGIGIVFKGTPDGGLEVHSFLPGGPAERAKKISVGDRLVSIEGTSIDLMSDVELAKKLLGMPGSTVSLGLKNQDGVDFEAEFERELLKGVHSPGQQPNA